MNVSECIFFFTPLKAVYFGTQNHGPTFRRARRAGTVPPLGSRRGSREVFTTRIQQSDRIQLHAELIEANIRPLMEADSDGQSFFFLYLKTQDQMRM